RDSLDHISLTPWFSAVIAYERWCCTIPSTRGVGWTRCPPTCSIRSRYFSAMYAIPPRLGSWSRTLRPFIIWPRSSPSHIPIAHHDLMLTPMSSARSTFWNPSVSVKRPDWYTPPPARHTAPRAPCQLTSHIRYRHNHHMPPRNLPRT